MFLEINNPNSYIWQPHNTLVVVMSLVGGLGLFLLGMQLLSRSMKDLAGKQMRFLLSNLSGNRFKGAGMGIFFTVLFQSSSATTVVMVSFVEAGLLVFDQTLPVLLGSALGTTITAQLVAFKIGQYALLGIGFGFLLSMAVKGRLKHFFEVLMSMGLIFFGMDIMAQSIKPLAAYQPFVDVITHLTNPAIALLLGVLATSLIQSSAAFIGILISLGASGLLDVAHCLPMILGANIGSTVAALISSISLGRAAKRVALANLSLKIATSLLFIVLLPQCIDFTIAFSGKNASLARQLANAHTIFNLALMLLWLPNVTWFAKLFNRFVLKDIPQPVFNLKFLTDDVLESPSLSIALLKKEVVDMGEVVMSMVDTSINLFIFKDERQLAEIRNMEQRVDEYREKINEFWLKSAHITSREKWPDEVYELLHLVNELEQIADLVSVNIVHQAEKWMVMNTDFSPQGKEELVFYHSRCIKQLRRALVLVSNRDYQHALKMKQKYREYAYMAFDLEMSHFKRLFDPGSQSVESSKIHIELLNLFRIINSRATNFGRIVLRDVSIH
jgi:phosphate:Na+ symporter